MSDVKSPYPKQSVIPIIGKLCILMPMFLVSPAAQFDEEQTRGGFPYIKIRKRSGSQYIMPICEEKDIVGVGIIYMTKNSSKRDASSSTSSEESNTLPIDTYRMRNLQY